MAIKKITLTENHLKLLSNIEISLDKDLKTIWYNQDSPYGRGSDKYTDMALILGFFENREIKYNDCAIYPDEQLELMQELDNYISENLESIMDIILQYCTSGVKPGTYKCKTNYRDWTLV
jgi:hypothetical protein